MKKENIERRLETIENKLGFLAGSHYSMIAGQFPSASDDEIDLRELCNVIWQAKWKIIATTFVFGVISLFYALSLPNIYKSEVLLAPAEENSGGGLAGLAGQFGGLASLAGVNLGGVSNDKTALALEILKSRAFISNFINEHALLVPLMAAEGWNREKDELSIDEDDYDMVEKKWVRDVSSPYQSKPSMLEAFEVFNEFLNVSQSKDTNFIRLGFEFYSPIIAKQWVDWLVKDINAAVKARDVAEAQRSIQYLMSQLEKTSIADMQTVFFELIEEQTKTVMFAEVRDEYVFKTIDEAVVVELKSKPKRALILVLGVILGGLFSLSFVLIRYFLFDEKTLSE